MSRIAAVDLGSLTVRLAVAEATGAGSYRILLHKREITALGEKVEIHGELGEAPQERTLQALSGFAAALREYGVAKGRAVATEAVRQARNGQEFLRKAGDVLQLPVSLLSPEEEAALTLTGVLSVLEERYRKAAALLVVDVGGGSSEFILVRQNQEPMFASLPVGVLSVSSSRPLGDPPNPTRVEDLKRELRRAFQDFLQFHFRRHLPQPPLLVGTAGAVTTLAAMAQELRTYDPQRVNNYLLRRSTVEELGQLLAALPEAERSRLPGLEPAKARVMVAGALIILAILHATRQEQMVTVDAGLLEGVLAELAK